MKSKRKITLRFRLHATAIGVVLILLILGFSIGFYIHLIMQHTKIINNLEFIKQEELELRKSEKNFLLYESTNVNFFKGNQSIYLDTIQVKTERIISLMHQLNSDGILKRMQVSSQLELLAQQFELYGDLIGILGNHIHARGFENYGLIGAMRTQIHYVEKIITEKENKQYLIHMLMLRRHEKDYLLRKDLKYKLKFDEELARFLEQIRIDKSPGYERLLELAESYNTKFNDIVAKDRLTGMVDNNGLIQEMSDLVQKIENNNQSLEKAVRKNTDNKMNEAFIILILLTIFLSAIIVILLLRTTGYIIRSIAHLQKYITRLGKGELPNKIVTRKRDEIAEMIDSINILSSNLRNTRDFAIEVGKGNLRTQINVFNNKGDLGGALIEMRNALEKVAKEQKIVNRDRENRVWVNEGLANFSVLLRNNTDSLHKLTNIVLSELINHIGALQGTVHVVDPTQDREAYRLTASVAVGERAIEKKMVYPGEDLLGRAVRMRTPIYLKKLPNDYMKIESALGYLPTQSLLILPLITYDRVMGILEIGSLKTFDEHVVTFVERLAKEFARAIHTVSATLKTKSLLEETREQAADLQARQNEILKQRSLLEKANISLEKAKEHTANSIKYAETIQNAFLPDIRLLKESFSEFFLLYRPRDIVSGDYYWYSEVFDAELNQYCKIIAVVDCTGHGVPGAFMSLIGNSVMNGIINEQGITSPATVLEELDTKISHLLKQNLGQGSNNDGMDVGICRIYETDNSFSIDFAGAKQNLFYRTKASGLVQVERGDRRTIGGARRKKIASFINKSFTLSKDDTIYLYTDGFTDQNNVERQKFGTQRLVASLNEIGSFSLSKQLLFLENTLDKFQGESPQRDDITLLGLRL